MLERPASPRTACSRRIQSKTSSARCGRSETMDPTAPTAPAQLLSRSPASSCGDWRPREPALSKVEGSMSSASSAAACGHHTSGPALVRIPAGWFLMGCDAGQDNEKPVHRVWVDEFLLAARQVTNADYGRSLRDAASLSLPPYWSDPAFNHPEQPVVGVSWYEAIRYCEWLSTNTGGKFRLPTEAEWERAARGGHKDADAGALFPWGDAPPQSLPGYSDRCAGHWKTGPEPVGRAETN